MLAPLVFWLWLALGFGAGATLAAELDEALGFGALLVPLDAFADGAADALAEGEAAGLDEVSGAALSTGVGAAKFPVLISADWPSW